MRSTKGGANESASTTEQDRRNHARMWILVSFGSHGSAKAKADDGSDQSMAPVPWFRRHHPDRAWPHGRGIGPRARGKALGINRREASRK